MYQRHHCHSEYRGSKLKAAVLEATKKHTLVTIIPHPQAIISKALDYILLIVDSSDPNLS